MREDVGLVRHRHRLDDAYVTKSLCDAEDVVDVAPVVGLHAHNVPRSFEAGVCAAQSVLIFAPIPSLPSRTASRIGYQLAATMLQGIQMSTCPCSRARAPAIVRIGAPT